MRERAGRDFPQDPREQLDLAIRAVFNSWNADRAVLYRRQERIPADLGTAVNVVAMVFGNLGDDSGTGVGVHPGPGDRRARRLRRLPAERAGRGRRGRHPQHRAAAGPGAHRQGVLRRADVDHGHPGGSLPGPVRHRVHDRARQAVDAADAGRQADGGGGLPDRDRAGRPGPHRHGRGAHPGHRGRAGPADVPHVRHQCQRHQDRHRRERIARRGRRPGGLRLRPRRRARGRRASRPSWSAARPTRTT